MNTVNVSLALCTVMFRRFMSSITGRIPAVVQSSTTPNTTALFMLSGALYYLYNHLKKGTLVRIGQGRPRHVGRSTSRLTIQRRHNNSSWFLRNARACRRKCTDAVYRIAKQSYESLHNLNPCVLLPNKSFHISFSKVSNDAPKNNESHNEESKNDCSIIYSNNAFDMERSEEDKTPEIQILQTPLKPVEQSHRSTGRRSNRYLKRLKGNVKLDNEVSVSSRFSSTQKNRKKNMKIKRMTRSGRVYSVIE